MIGFDIFNESLNILLEKDDDMSSLGFDDKDDSSGSDNSNTKNDSVDSKDDSSTNNSSNSEDDTSDNKTDEENNSDDNSDESNNSDDNPADFNIDDDSNSDEGSDTSSDDSSNIDDSTQEDDMTDSETNPQTKMKKYMLIKAFISVYDDINKVIDSFKQFGIESDEEKELINKTIENFLDIRESLYDYIQNCFDKDDYETCLYKFQFFKDAMGVADEIIQKIKELRKNK